MASGNDHTRVSAGAGVALGNAYDHANISAATSPSQAELNRVGKGVGIGAGSQINYTNFSATSATERVNEDARAGKAMGLGAGSPVNPA